MGYRNRVKWTFSLFTGLIIAAACFLSAVYSYKDMEEDNGLDKYYVLFQLLSIRYTADKKRTAFYIISPVNNNKNQPIL